MSVKDFRGKEIKVGDRIVYAVRWGSNLDLKQAVVDGIGTLKGIVGDIPTLEVTCIPHDTDYKGTPYKTRLTSLSTVVSLGPDQSEDA